MGFKDDFEKEIARAAARVSECRIAIRKRQMEPEDQQAFEVALQSGVSKDRIKAALNEDQSVDFPVGETSIQKHRTHACSCFKEGGPLYKKGRKK